MTRKQLVDISKAVEYARRGVPIKDAFDTGHDERDTVLAAFRYVLKHQSDYEPRGLTLGEQSIVESGGASR